MTSIFYLLRFQLDFTNGYYHVLLTQSLPVTTIRNCVGTLNALSSFSTEMRADIGDAVSAWVVMLHPQGWSFKVRRWDTQSLVPHCCLRAVYFLFKNATSSEAHNFPSPISSHCFHLPTMVSLMSTRGSQSLPCFSAQQLSSSSDFHPLHR